MRSYSRPMGRGASTPDPVPAAGETWAWTPASIARASASLVGAYLLSFWWATTVGIGGPILIWYPPAALAIAAAIVIGARIAPVLLLAEVLATWWLSGYGDDFGPVWTIVNAAVLTGAYVGTGELLRRLGADPALRTTSDLGWFVLVGVLGGPALAAVGGIAVQVAAGVLPSDDLLRDASIFWVGDAVAVVTLAPTLLLLVAAARAGRRLPPELATMRSAELAEVLLPATVAVALLLTGEEATRFLYLCLLPMAWVAHRRGMIGAALAGAATASATVAAAHGQIADALDRSELQVLLGTVAVAGLVIGAIERDRREASSERRELADIIEASPDIIVALDAEGLVTYVNPAGRATLPISTSGSMLDELCNLGGPETTVAEAIERAITRGSWIGEGDLRTADGRTMLTSQVLIAHPDADGVVRRLSVVCRDITDRRRLVEQLHQRSMHDDSTGLANRSLLIEQLGQALAEQREVPSAVVLIDLARFSMTNERFGYQTGDKILRTIAARLSQAAAPHLVARHGGNVFAVLHPRIPDELVATATVRRLLDAVTAPVVVDGRSLPIDARAGVVLTTDPAVLAADYLRNAESALQRCKRVDQRITLFDPAMDRRAHELLDLEIELRAAIAGEQWHLAYQPVVDLALDELVGFEALLRWEHPTRGPVNPMQVVAIAETTGLIHPLGLQILRRACEQAMQWAAQGIDLTVAVNVSGRQLEADGFAQAVLDTASATGLPPQRLIIEITEGVLAAEDAELSVIHALHDAGCRLALDDFGTGHSSLGRLRDLPIDILKIDRSFIIDLGHEQSARATVEAIIAVGHALDMTIVAEGVEDEVQAEALRALGCDHVQGYLWSKPLVPDAFADWATAR